MKDTRGPRVPGASRSADDLAVIVREWFYNLQKEVDPPGAAVSPEKHKRGAVSKRERAAIAQAAEKRERAAIAYADAQLAKHNLDEPDLERINAMISKQIRASAPHLLLAQKLVAARRLGELLPEVYRCMEWLSPWSFSKHGGRHTASRPAAYLSTVQSLRSFCSLHNITVQPIDSSPDGESAWIRNKLTVPVKSQLHRELREQGIARTITEASAIMGEGPDAQRQRERRLREAKGASSSRSATRSQKRPRDARKA
jgi:hypothetical protein